MTSITYTTSNENRRPELVFEYNRTFFQKLFSKPATIERYELFQGRWFNKDTKNRVELSTNQRFDRIVTEIQYANSFNETN